MGRRNPLEVARPSPSPAIAVAAYGIRDSRLTMPLQPLEEEEWSEFFLEVRTQGLEGFLARAVKDGVWLATPVQSAQLRQAHQRAAAKCLLLERLAVRLSSELANAGIEVRVLKGPASAHLLYPDPAMRLFRDVDLLVPSLQMDNAVSVLEGRRCRRRWPEPRPGFDRRFSKGVEFTTADGLEIDLHRTFVAGPYGMTVDVDSLFVRSTPFEVAGTTLLALSYEDRFLHACYHAALGDLPARVVPLRDLIQLLVMTSLDVNRVLDTARAWKAQAVVARAISLAALVFELTSETPLVTWARAYRPTRYERFAMSSYDAVGRTYGTEALAGLIGIRGVSSRLDYLRALAFPDRTYFEGRYRSRRERWLVATKSYLKRNNGSN